MAPEAELPRWPLGVGARIIPIAIDRYYHEGRGFCILVIFGHELQKICLARAIILEAHDREAVPAHCSRHTGFRLVQRAPELWRHCCGLGIIPLRWHSYELIRRHVRHP